MPPRSEPNLPLRSPSPAHAPSLRARVRPEMVGLLLGCLCLAATNALSLTIPWLLKGAIDALRQASQAAAALASGGGGGAVRHLVIRNAALIAGLAILQAVIRTWSRVLIFNAGRNIEYALRRDLFRHLTTLDPRFFRRRQTGDVMSRLTNDLGAVRMLFGPGLLNVVNTALVYATSLWLLVRLSPRLTLVALLPYPLLLLGARISTRLIYRSSREIQEQMGVLSTAVQEDLAGIQVIKHYTLEDHRHAAFRKLNDEYLTRALRLVRARGSLMPLFAGLGGVGTLVVLWAGGREVIAGRLTIGGLVAFNAYLVLLSWPTIALGWVIGIWQRGAASWLRVRELLATPSEIEDPPHAQAPASLPPSIAVRGLTLTADDGSGRRLLDDVSFSLPAGAMLAIVGPTGAGKTTLVDALVRLQNVPPGTVQVGGADVTTLPLARLRAMFGYAPQDAFLFSATVAENIAFGFASSDGGPEDRERVRRAADAAGLGPDLAALPEGYDTLVGERGITLSGGQRQRVALARALAAEPRILILDDSLSSVDAETERAILEQLRPILAGRTSIVVSHRVATVRDADQILVLDGGRIVERGTHAELLAAEGLYTNLYREQLAADALAQGAA